MVLGQQNDFDSRSINLQAALYSNRFLKIVENYIEVSLSANSILFQIPAHLVSRVLQRSTSTNYLCGARNSRVIAQQSCVPIKSSDFLPLFGPSGWSALQDPGMRQSEQQWIQVNRMVHGRGSRLHIRALTTIASVVSRSLLKMGPLENAKKIAAYKAVDEYVKVIIVYK